jgi:hypothetical protein
MSKIIPCYECFLISVYVPHLGEEYRLRVFKNRVLRIFGPRRRKMDCGENCIMMNFTACILYRILLG